MRNNGKHFGAFPHLGLLTTLWRYLLLFSLFHKLIRTFSTMFFPSVHSKTGTIPPRRGLIIAVELWLPFFPPKGVCRLCAFHIAPFIAYETLHLLPPNRWSLNQLLQSFTAHIASDVFWYLLFTSQSFCFLAPTSPCFLLCIWMASKCHSRLTLGMIIIITSKK